MTALTANANPTRLVDQELREFPVGAAQHIYNGSLVGVDPARMLKTFVPGDKFVGVAYGECDNSAGAAAAKYAKVTVQSDFEFTLSGAAHTHTGQALFATDDATVSVNGHPDAFVGRVIHKDADTAGKVVFRLKGPFETPKESDFGCHLIATDFTDVFDATGAASASKNNGGLIHKSILGTGVSQDTDAKGVASLNFDAVAEVALDCIKSALVMPVAGGLTMETRLHVEDHGDDAALDIDFGFGTLLTTNSEANVDHADMVNLAAYHMDGNADDVLAQSDDNTTDVAAVDTTVNNIETDADASYKVYLIVVRPTGAVEFWVDGVRVLSTTTFAVGAASSLQAFINMEKTSNDTTAIVNVDYLRVGGARV